MAPHSKTRFILLAALCVVVATGMASAQLKVGDEVSFRADSPHPYPTGRGDAPAWNMTIEHPGATYIAVHFDRFELAPGDRVVVRSGSARQSYTFREQGKAKLGTFWATHIKGDHAVIELFSPRPGPGGWGVSIDKYVAGFHDLGAEGPEAICGPDDKENAICYAGSEPDIYDHSRAVARLLIQGSSLCTGWLVGCEGHLFTNEHCITSDSDAINTDYEFLSESDACGPVCNDCPGEVWAGAASLVQDDAPHDYAFIHLEGNPQNTYGSFLLDDRVPAVGERIYIPQHAGGRAKEIGVFSTHDDDAGGLCQVSGVNEEACAAGGPPDVGYFCDTEGGSSGSPIVAYGTHQAIALHHCRGNLTPCPNTGGDANRGVPITAVIDHLGALLPACAVMPGPALRYDSHLADDSAGNGDGVVDPGEALTVEVDLLNGGSEGATGISAQLSSTHPGVIVTDDSADWMDMAAGVVETSLAPHYTVDVTSEVVCGDVIDFDLDITSNEGTWSSSFSEQVGVNVAGQTTINSTDTPIAIPDNDPVGIFSTINVANALPIGDINVQVALTHTWIGDLTLTLVAPGGQIVTLHNRSGSSADDINTIYDSVTPVDGPGTLGMFDGQNAVGNWTLVVTDTAGQDLGVLNRWSLIIDEPVDWRCDGGGGALTLSAPTPGDAGTVNTWEITNGTMGETVRLFLGRQGGTTLIPGCPGLLLDMTQPRQIGSSGLDGNTVSISRSMPPGFAGRTVRFQAVVQSTCEVSNVVVHTFP